MLEEGRKREAAKIERLQNAMPPTLQERNEIHEAIEHTKKHSRVTRLMGQIEKIKAKKERRLDIVERVMAANEERRQRELKESQR